MKFYSLAIIVFSILFLSCSNKRKEQNDNFNSGKSELKEFLFVGLINDEPGIYKYNLIQKTYEPFLSGKIEKVVQLSYSDKMKNVFFMTAKDFGKNSGFPFIHNVKLFLINPETEKADFIEGIGNGIQVFSQWQNESSFRIIINSFDKTIANYVNQRKILYNTFGKKLEDIAETYDITKQGYPQISEKTNHLSTNQKYSIEVRGNDSIGVYLKGDVKEKLIIKSTQQVKQLEWRNNFIFLSTINLKADNESIHTRISETSKLIVYSLKKDKIIKLWEGSGLKNFFIAGDYLVFDDGFDKDSHIILYDLRKRKNYSEIKINGGCGLRNIPQIPDNGAKL